LLGLIIGAIIAGILILVLVNTTITSMDNIVCPDYNASMSMTCESLKNGIWMMLWIFPIVVIIALFAAFSSIRGVLDRDIARNEPWQEVPQMTDLRVAVARDDYR
jgi:hypothetical protein